jgi:uncharacterized Zn-binding protein involved in type VI secretion
MSLDIEIAAFEKLEFLDKYRLLVSLFLKSILKIYKEIREMKISSNYKITINRETININEKVNENMPFAATKKSKTSHGDPLSPGPGSRTVKIVGRPAWRAIVDFHKCPVTSPVTHTGGKVLKGSTKVFINGFPAVRVNDKIIEAAGPPNIILKGNSKVIIV